MRRTTRALLAAPAAALALLAGSVPVSAEEEPSLAAVGLTGDGRLVAFRVGDTSKAAEIGKVNGLKDDKKLVGIDFRVQDGKLYGVGDQGGIYTLHDKAEAKKVSELTVDLEGDAFGVDFNPAADRLRIVSDTGQNLRHDVREDGETIEDDTLTFPGPPEETAVGITAVAYTNNDEDDTTATTLFDIDTRIDQVVIQSPANAGLLAAVGQLGVDVGPSAGFDIYSELEEGKTVANAGFATFRVDQKYRLYEVDLLTGATESLGDFPDDHQVVDLSIALDNA
ncbi:MAG: DUF4394 domain-containing protein [Egibacteraceae bacterium]